MKTLFNLLLIMLIAIPVFAVFLLLHRLEKNKPDEGAADRFFRALCDAYSVGGSPEKSPRALTEEERIELARRIAEDPFADVGVKDIISEQPEEATDPEEKNSDTETLPSDSETVPSEESTGKKISREEALAMVSAMMGQGKKSKGSSFAELQKILDKYSKK